MEQTGSIFFLVTYIIVAAAMIGIGISQWKSKKPVGFYSGVKPPEEDELSDVYEIKFFVFDLFEKYVYIW